MKRKIIHVKQNTKDWREWRDKGLGASDAPVVMGKSPWTSRFMLWAYKTGLLIREEPNGFQAAAMQRGHDLEPKAREMYEAVTGDKFPATSFEHPDFPFLRASLDGYCMPLNKNLEIKCPGKIDHEIAMSGKVPAKYMPQLQMQMLVSNAGLTDYVSWDGKSKELAIVSVVPDTDMQGRILIAMCNFWNWVETKTPPPVSSKEVADIFAIVQNDFDRVTKSFKVLSHLCEAIAKGEKND